MTDIDWIARVVALAGLALGLLNYWRSRDRDTVKLRLKADWQRGIARARDGSGDGTNWIVVEIINASAFPITVKDVGFSGADGRSLGEPYTSRKDFPRTLGARDSCRTQFGLRWIPDEYLETIANIYASTATGETVRLTRKQWKQVESHLREVEPPEESPGE